MPQQIVPPTVGLATQGTTERSDVLVTLCHVSFQAVKFGESFAAGGAVIQNPEANLFLICRDVAPLLSDLVRVLGLRVLLDAFKQVGHT